MPSRMFFPRSLVPGSFQGFPSPGWREYPIPGWGGDPKTRYPPGQVRMEYPPPGHIRMGYPPPPNQDRTTERALATERAICLLRSCRRIFLFYNVNGLGLRFGKK